MPSSRLFVGIAVLAALAGLTALGCAASPLRAPLFEDIGPFGREVSTASSVAQRYFDQGLVFTYAFNYEEALRSYREAERADPSCAMAAWGVALVSGPHINNTAMDLEAARRAYDAARRALGLSGGATPVERALIEALMKRYAWPPPEDRKALDSAYADAMRQVHRSFPHDPDVAALFAESLMDLRPWDLWTPDGKPQPGTEEILAVLEGALARHPDHPQLCHAYIHAVEASPDPEKALPSADRLRHRLPGAPHLVHMPSHIDFRLGRYGEAAAANERAMEADRRYVEQGGGGTFYALYRAHDAHFLAWACMFEGRSEVALRAARDLVLEMPEESVRAMPDFLEGFLATPLHVLVRFGRWDDILLEPRPPAGRPVTTAFWHYARGVALSVEGRLDEAAAEIAAFEKGRAAVPETALLGNNTARQVLEIAAAMLRGEYLFRRGELEEAFASLREASRLDMALRYDEPWSWMQPADHALGALLLQAGRVEEAEQVYRRDLARHPENGWSLHGLSECLRRRGQVAEAEVVDARLRRAWARSDVKVAASCFCRTDVSRG